MSYDYLFKYIIIIGDTDLEMNNNQTEVEATSTDDILKVRGKKAGKKTKDPNKPKRPPKTEEEIFNEVLEGELDLSSDPWQQVSESAKDLIRKMLERNPKQRLTAQQVLCHPWIRDEGNAPDTPLDTTVLSRLKKFSATDKLNKMALRVIAERISEEEIQGLRETFKIIDSEKSERVTYKELKRGLERFKTNLDNSDINSIMQMPTDVHLEDTVDYEEFIEAIVRLKQIQEEETKDPLDSSTAKV